MICLAVWKFFCWQIVIFDYCVQISGHHIHQDIKIFRKLNSFLLMSEWWSMVSDSSYGLIYGLWSQKLDYHLFWPSWWMSPWYYKICTFVLIGGSYTPKIWTFSYLAENIGGKAHSFPILSPWNSYAAFTKVNVWDKTFIT